MSESTPIRLAALIREKRQDAGLSHEALSVSAGVDRSTISLIESGKRVPTISTAERIAVALGVRLSELIAEAEK